MENINLDERRVNRRVPIDIDIEVCHLQEEGVASDLSIISCRGRDVSKGGVSFYGQMRYQDESLLRLRIVLSGEKSSPQVKGAKLLKVMGKVMWCKKNSETSEYVTGVQFLNIYEQDFDLLTQYVELM